jgi:cobaltochelatase CobT
LSTNITSAASAKNSEEFELFQAATASCVRALGQSPQHAISFGRLWQSGPEQTEFPNIADENVLRGLSDLQAAQLRFHARLKQPEFPSAAQRELFEFLEQARCAACLGHIYAGARCNIAEFWQRDPIVDFKWLNETDPPAALLNSILMEARMAWLEQDYPSSVHEIDLQQLKALLPSQGDFALAAASFLRKIWTQLQKTEQSQDKDTPPVGHSTQAEPDPAQQDQGTPLEMQQDADSQNAPPPPMGAQTAVEETVFSSADDQDNGMMLEAPQPAESRMGAMARYRIFTTAYDEVIPASDLCELRERQKLRAELETHLVPFQRLVQKLALQLQHQLQSYQPIGWQRGLDDGLLDLKRLSMVYSHRHNARPRIYKQPQLGLTRDAAVTLLLDNSGSMRGRPIMITALCADILARTLERCGVRVEILGFTTRAWKGGNPAKEWQTQNRPSHPGRLNELRHIIYKSADQNWQQARLNIPVMLKDGLLRENIDGEALLWAAQRLKRRHERRKILMVISDGAPVDDATLSANAPNYLEQHLHDTIAWLQQDKNIELAAIGIGHDVTRYYPNATVIKDAETLAETMLTELKRLLKREQAA